MAERPYLYYGYVSTLKALHKLLQAQELSYVYYESEATIGLTAYALPEPDWTHGRAFGPTAELRWEQNGEGYELLLLTDNPATAEAWQPRLDEAGPGEDSAWQVEQGQILLWGTHLTRLEQPHRLEGEQGDAWVETRIPRALNYPVSGSPRWVKANVKIYRRYGQPLLTRLVNLEGAYDESQTLW